MQDDPRIGQPKMQRTGANVDLVCSEGRVGVRVIAEDLIMDRETGRQIVKEDLGVKKISAKMVPRISTQDQKQRRLHISSDLLHNAEMCDRVITGDETLCFQYDQKQNDPAYSGKHRIKPRPQKACMSRSQGKTMLVCFFKHKGIVHYEFISQG